MPFTVFYESKGNRLHGTGEKTGAQRCQEAPQVTGRRGLLAVGFYHSDTVEVLHPCLWEV